VKSFATILYAIALAGGTMFFLVMIMEVGR